MLYILFIWYLFQKTLINSKFWNFDGGNKFDSFKICENLD